MSKKLLLIILIPLIVLIAAPIGWYYWQLNYPPDLGEDDLSKKIPAEISYYNEKYKYSLKFPEEWFVGFLGDSKEEANVVWFVSDEKDLEQGDGGPPVGAKVEVIVQDLEEQRLIDPRFPEINSAKDWLDWERSGWSKFSREPVETRKYEERTVTLAGKEAIRTTYKEPEFVEAGPGITITLFDSDIIYQINYLGRKPFYTESLGKFEEIVKSFAVD